MSPKNDEMAVHFSSACICVFTVLDLEMINYYENYTNLQIINTQIISRTDMCVFWYA